MAILLSEAAVSKTILSITSEVIGSDEDTIDEVGEPLAPSESVTASGTASVASSSLPGAPKKWEPPCPPIDWLSSYSSNDKNGMLPMQMLLIIPETGTCSHIDQNTVISSIPVIILELGHSSACECSRQQG